LALLSLAAAGCGDDNNAANASNTATTGKTGDAMQKDDAAMKEDVAMKKDEAKMSATGKVVQVGSTNFGKILQDRRGRTLYLFTKEKGKTSKCYGDCARAWPPMITKGEPRARKGAIQSKLGTTKRRDGKLQVTYNGHPLYYYVDEDEPDEVLCQAVDEFGGIWYIVNRKGNAIKS
jgi:predicted lipoprotein with Yx(FWY)xxD motif